MKRLIIIISIFTIVLSACNGTAVPPDSESDSPSTGGGESTPTPFSQPTEVEDEISPAQPGAGGDVLLNEICFLPADGDSGYLELKNISSEAVSLVGLSLENESGQIITLPDGQEIEPQQVLLIRFEKKENTSSDVLFLSDSEFLNVADGQVKLWGKEGQLLDKVAWGENQPEAVKMGLGGIQQEPEPGSSIGRIPSSTRLNRWDWVIYTGDEISPGAVNPIPAVEVMQPLNGALLHNTIVQLLWYPVPGADHYRLQIARNVSFTNIAMDVEVTSAFKYTNPLASGTYYWRVQSVTHDTTASDFSLAQSFQIQIDPADGDENDKFILDIPILQQHKDSNMLLLESQHQIGAKAWNRPHEGYDPNEPAHISNNALAVIAMLNHFYGGDITQDRLGYEIFKDRTAGPELDLAYGLGPTSEQVEQLFAFALSATTNKWQGNAHDDIDEMKNFISFIKRSIVAGNPVLAYTYGHFVLIQGYETFDNHLMFWLIDPAAGAYKVYADQPTWLSAISFTDPIAATLEDTLLTDSDEDGILDFDEMERFHTDVFKVDSDSDGIPDMLEIQASVFDLQYGYGHHPQSLGRDIDMDGFAMELDFDSDNGGCIDSYEDRDMNGKYTPQYQETSNFDPDDDNCFALEMTWTYRDDWGNSTVIWNGSLGIDGFNNVSGTGVVTLSHTGSCTDSEMLATFSIKGKLDDEIELQIIHQETFEISTFSAEELKPDCSLAMAIEENWTVSHGVYAGMPVLIQVPLPPAGQTATLKLNTNIDAPRSASIELTLTYLEGQD